MIESKKSTQSNFILCAEDPEANYTSYDTSNYFGGRNLNLVGDNTVKTISIAMIGIGMVLQGVAKAPRGPFTTVYLDDGCDRKRTGFYFGKFIIKFKDINGPAKIVVVEVGHDYCEKKTNKNTKHTTLKTKA